MIRSLVTSLGLVTLLFGCASIKDARERIKEGRFFTKASSDKEFFHNRWSKELDLPRSGSGLTVNTISPYVHNGILFQGTIGGDFIAYSLEDGRELWRVKESSSVSSQGGVFKNSIVYGTIQGRLIARDQLTGKLVYQVDLGSSIQARPTFFKGRVLIHSRDHRLISLDAATGKILWSFKRSLAFTSTIQGYSVPLGYKNQIIIGFADGYVASVSLEDGLLNWEKKLSNASKFLDVDASPRIIDGNLYIGSLSGRVFKINPNNGVVLNQFNYSLSAPVLELTNAIILPTIDGKLVRVERVGDSDKIKEILLERNAPISDVKVWKGSLVVSNTKGKIFRLNSDSLEVLEKFWLGNDLSAIYGALVVKEDTLAFMSSRSRLYVFE